ncbi:MAG: anthranilate synthase component I family protein [Chitinophagaceae bacterium]
MYREFKIKAPELFKEKVLDWLQPFDTFCFLDSHGYADPYGKWDWVAAAGVASRIHAMSTDEVTSQLADLDQTLTAKGKWWFGHLSFGLQTTFQRVESPYQDALEFSPFSFFSPAYLIACKGGTVFVEAADPQELFNKIQDLFLVGQASEPRFTVGPLQQRVSRPSYVEIIDKIKQHIQQGDCYEMNYCQEFFSDTAMVDPMFLYRQFMKISPAPFSAFYRLGARWVLSASPERFLCKRGTRLISQPIKGTARRDLQQREADELIKEHLRSSEKERAENVMIVDLVRNDLSRICKAGTVVVEELFGVYSFPQVHQMISTVSGELPSSVSFSEILKATFPMGSMTGAPKKRVLELTAQIELAARGLYSGSIGYIDPAGDFDFNVVIRSLLYHSEKNYLSFQVGGGITINSDPEKEWEECLVKAAGLLKLLGQRISFE